ncbi:RNA-splicing factor [Kickxella alabastrina]|nr:RNA-splicing factor [Kickxella alabastrina]
MSAADSANHNDDVPAPLFKKSKRRGANIRKRPVDSNEDEGNDVDKTSVSRPDADNAGGVVDGDSADGPGPTKQLKTTNTVAPSRRENDSDNDADTGSANNSNTHGTIQVAKVEYHFRKAMDSTRTSEHDAPAELKQGISLQQSKPVTGSIDAGSDGATNAEEDDGLYKGKKGYTNRVSGTGSRRAGPFKAPANLRATSVFDYQPNVCKDYKETGYCGYGDSCIFLHDRGTYKSGWQLEKEFEESQMGIQRDNPKLWKVENVSDDEESSAKKGSEKLPFACLICRKPFQKPIITKCQHYFCEGCALKHYRKTPKCFACGAATAGVFKPAKNLEPNKK